LLIPAIAQVRQLLAVTGSLNQFPLFIFLVYFLLRTIGPLMNWYTHIHLKKRIHYWSLLNIITYLLLGYVIYDFFYTLALQKDIQSAYVVESFSEKNFFSVTYPIIQLLHLAQATYLFHKERKNRQLDDPIFFVKYILYTVIITLLFLQVSYFIFERTEVELLVAPIIFLIIYSVIVLVSIKYSTIYTPKLDVLKNANYKHLEILSDRENQVLKLLALGKSDQEIADELSISYHTVRTYCQRIFNKIDVNNRNEAAHYFTSRL